MSIYWMLFWCQKKDRLCSVHIETKLINFILFYKCKVWLRHPQFMQWKRTSNENRFNIYFAWQIWSWLQIANQSKLTLIATFIIYVIYSIFIAHSCYHHLIDVHYDKRKYDGRLNCTKLWRPMSDDAIQTNK